MFSKDTIQCLGVVILRTPPEDTPVCRPKEGHEIGSTVSSVLELSSSGMPGDCRKIRRQTLYSLNPGALIKAEKILRWIQIQAYNVFGFRKKLWVSDLKKILL